MPGESGGAWRGHPVPPAALCGALQHGPLHRLESATPLGHPLFWLPQDGAPRGEYVLDAWFPGLIGADGHSDRDTEIMAPAPGAVAGLLVRSLELLSRRQGPRLRLGPGCGAAFPRENAGGEQWGPGGCWGHAVLREDAGVAATRRSGGPSAKLPPRDGRGPRARPASVFPDPSTTLACGLFVPFCWSQVASFVDTPLAVFHVHLRPHLLCCRPPVDASETVSTVTLF